MEPAVLPNRAALARNELEPAVRESLDELNMTVTLTKPIAGDFTNSGLNWTSAAKSGWVPLVREPTMYELGLEAVGDIIDIIRN